MQAKRSDTFDFMMGFIDNSRQYKSQFIDKWVEVLSNFIVEPYEQDTRTVDRPYVAGSQRLYGRNSSGSRGFSGSSSIILKDGETHKAIMTYSAQLVLAMFGDSRGEYIRANPVGYEDARGKASTVTRLMRYAFSIPGHFREMVHAVIDANLFGTAVIKSPWKFQQREMPVREIEMVEGIELDNTTRQLVTSYDDVALRCIDVQDAFPDPSEPLIVNMTGFGEKFRVNAIQARAKARAGVWDSAAVDRAISDATREARQGARSQTRSYEDSFRENIDQPRDTEEFGSFTPMIGYEYWGDVPWEDNEGSSRKKLVTLNGQVVQDAKYPLADPNLPYHEMVINPMTGRFYGISPAEVIRYDQDLMDAVKILSAEAVIRQVHPPIAFDEDSGLDASALRNWSSDMPIPIRGGPKSVGTLQYDANVFNGFAQMSKTKQDMQETSGALNTLQGQGLGTSRASATQANFQQQQALGRPELAAIVIERECLPSLAKGILRRYQQFLEGSEDLAERVGEDPTPVWIGDIMGDFDIKFVGSRMAMSRQEKLQNYDRLNGLTSTNQAAQMAVPWDRILRDLVGDTMELPEVAAQIGDPQVMLQNMLMQMLLGQGQGAGNGNGAGTKATPAGALPAQTAGSPIA